MLSVLIFLPLAGGLIAALWPGSASAAGARRARLAALRDGTLGSRSG